MKKFILIITGCVFICFFCGCGKKDFNRNNAAIHGMVTDVDTGEPIAHASVQYTPSGETALTGNDGWYEFLKLEPRQYTISVQKAGYGTDRKTIEAVVGEKIKVDFQLKEN